MNYLEKARELQATLKKIEEDSTPEKFYSSEENFNIPSRLEELILDFKTLAYSKDKDAPLYPLISSLPEKAPHFYEAYHPLFARIEYLLGKFSQYSVEE